ncbi:MAG: M64 family metallopeptidase [Bdellovibrionota bacterium]
MKTAAITSLFIFSLLFSSLSFAESFRVQKKVSSKNRSAQILSVAEVSGQTEKILRKIPYYIAEGPGSDTDTLYIEEIKSSLTPAEVAFYKTIQKKLKAKLANTEVRELITEGPANNRIHLTILGDGYTLQDKDKFFADAERITKNLFSNDTFASYLSLFQVHAVFVPSKMSGIGDGASIDTAFGLYRTPKGSKRAIYPGDEMALQNALDLVERTDYPIVIANDDFYGGLGGRYAISTRSIRSGMTVLNHELGHNFGEVGEEYDGGSVYSGANASSDAKASQWSLWRDDKNNYEAKLLSSNYVWQNLKNKPYKTTFKTQAGESLGLELSVVGWSSPEDVYVYVNGQKLNLGGPYHNDRNFFILDNLQTQVGNNTLEIKENLADGDNVLATADIYAYPQGFNFTKDVTAAFATYAGSGRKTYRPTHDSCLMRNMNLKHFCAVDQENMWHKFLNRISLVDHIIKTSDKVTIETPELSGLSVRWYNADGSEISALNNQFEVARSAFGGAKNIKVSVELQTPEVRKYDSKFKVVKSIQL